MSRSMNVKKISDKVWTAQSGKFLGHGASMQTAVDDLLRLIRESSKPVSKEIAQEKAKP